MIKHPAGKNGRMTLTRNLWSSEGDEKMQKIHWQNNQLAAENFFNLEKIELIASNSYSTANL